MKRHFNLFRVILKKSWIEMCRYYFDTITSILNNYVIFFFLFIGYKSFLGKSVEGSITLESLITGYIFWLFSVGTLGGSARIIIQEARSGTLEQLYMTPLGFKAVIFYSIMADFFIQLLNIIPVLLLAMLTTGKMLAIRPFTFVTILFLTMLSGYGIGLAIGGLSLVYKNALAIARSFQFIYIGFISAPIDANQFIKLLPFSLGTKMASQTVTTDISLFSMSISDISILLFSSLTYLVVGFFVIHICENIAKNQGTLGHY